MKTSRDKPSNGVGVTETELLGTVLLGALRSLRAFWCFTNLDLASGNCNPV